MHPVIGRCPICSHELTVTRLQCRGCGSGVDGAFHLGPLQRLNGVQIQFVEALVRARGSLKDVGAELGISYPTVNSRLNEILLTLGYGDRVKTSEIQEGTPLPIDRRRDILSQVRDGTLSAIDADRLLRELP